jgi:anaerobic dimethyl sulfoxide reductase subunit A
MNPRQQHRAPSSGTRNVAVACNNNCGGRCRLTAYIENGAITRIGTDEAPDTPSRPQLRACMKGRALRSRLSNPNRLRYPMKRVGPRGEGEFQRISWDEAVDAVASNLKRTVDRHGPGSVYLQYATGDCGLITGHAAAQRLMNLMGGYLARYNDYSSACVNYTAPFVTGYRDTNSYQTLAHSKLIILNGFNPAETIFETNSNYYLARAKEAGARIVVIDPRLTDTAATFADQWLPLKPTTDAALFVAMAHVLFTEKLCDRAFLDKHCIGHDEQHMPHGVPARLSFESYVLGLRDGVEKTPEWASQITGVEAHAIRDLARLYGTLHPAQLLRGRLSGRGVQQARRGRYRGARSREVHRLPVLHLAVSLRSAAVRRARRQGPQVQSVPGRSDACLRGGMPDASH